MNYGKDNRPGHLRNNNKGRYTRLYFSDRYGWAKRDGYRAADIIKNWIRNRSTHEFPGTWEIIHNTNFKVVEFDHFTYNYTVS